MEINVEVLNTKILGFLPYIVQHSNRFCWPESIIAEAKEGLTIEGKY